MRIVPLLAVSLIGVVALFALPSEKLRSCGHPRDPVWSSISPFKATHCCTSGRTVNQLFAIYYAQRVYQMDHGEYASTFEQLTNEYRQRPGDYYFSLVGGSDWSVTVTQQETLAGSYLLTSDGKLHFNKGKMVTTNDLVLADLNNR